MSWIFFLLLGLLFVFLVALVCIAITVANTIGFD